MGGGLGEGLGGGIGGGLGGGLGDLELKFSSFELDSEVGQLVNIKRSVHFTSIYAN